MISKELKAIVKKGESETVEFKRSTAELKEAVISVVAAGVKAEFKRLKTGFVVVFHRPKWEDRSERVPERVPEKVTENQRRIVEAISKNQNITIVELAQIVGISERKIKTNIFKLKEKGLLCRIGPDKGGHWEVSG